MKQISAFEINKLVEELQSLLNSKIDKIFMDNKEEIYVQLHIPNLGKKILRIEVGKGFHLTDVKPKFEKANSFCLSLRKLINNARIRKIEQIDFERIISIELEKDKKYKLIVEIFSKGNIILTDKDNKIINCLFKQKFTQRKLLPKEQYKHPKLKYNFLKLTKDQLTEMLKSTNKGSLVKALAIELGLGGKYSEQLCGIAGINKDLKPKNVKDLDKLFLSMKKLKLILPKEFKTLNEYLDSEFKKELMQKKTIEELAYEKELNKTKRMINIQQKTIKNYEKAIKENEKNAEIIYQHYQLIDSIIKELRKIEKKHSWQEIKKRLKGHKIIKEVDVKHKEIILELK